MSEQFVATREDIAAMKQDIKNLKGWQETQNTTLQRLEVKFDQKFDKLVYWIMGEMAAFVLLAVSLWFGR